MPCWSVSQPEESWNRQADITLYVVSMRNNPYDDIFKNLAKMMEDLLRNLPNQGTSQFVGYTIITEPGQPPRVLRRDREGNKHEIPYELIETKDRIFVTAEIAADKKEAPYAQ